MAQQGSCSQSSFDTSKFNLVGTMAPSPPNLFDRWSNSNIFLHQLFWKISPDRKHYNNKSSPPTQRLNKHLSSNTAQTERLWAERSRQWADGWETDEHNDEQTDTMTQWDTRGSYLERGAISDNKTHIIIFHDTFTQIDTDPLKDFSHPWMLI